MRASSPWLKDCYILCRESGPSEKLRSGRHQFFLEWELETTVRCRGSTGPVWPRFCELALLLLFTYHCLYFIWDTTKTERSLNPQSKLHVGERYVTRQSSLHASRRESTPR